MTVAYFKATSSSRTVYKNVTTNYADAHNAAEGVVYDAAGPSTRVMNSWGFFTNYWSVYRGFLFFPTAGLPDDADITAARIYFHLVSHDEDDSGRAALYLVEGVQNDPVVSTDFGDHLSKTTSHGSLDFANQPSALTNFWVALNATGIAQINKTGDTKFCVRIGGDIDNSTPTGKNDVNCGYYSSTLARCTTGSATLKRVTTATLNAIFDGQLPTILEVTYTGAEATYPRSRFQYGATVSYGTDTVWQGGLLQGDAFSQAITELALNTLYHFRAQTENASGSFEGDDETFTTAGTPGFIWVDGRRFYFISEVHKQHIKGRYASSGATAGHLFVEGRFLHYVDEDGYERRRMGIRGAGSGVDVSNGCPIWVEKARIHYIDASGYERFLPLTWINTESFNEAVFNA